jgi:hypothetical protein
MTILKSFLILSLSLVASNAFALAVSGSPGTPLPADVAVILDNSATAGPAVKVGSNLAYKKIQLMKAVYDVAVLGGASGTSIVLKDAVGGQAVLPGHAIVKQVIVDTRTVPTGGASSKISFGVNSQTDLVGSTAIASYANVTAGTPVGTAATMFKVASVKKAIFASIAGTDLTAGKISLFIEYYLSDL